MQWIILIGDESLSLRKFENIKHSYAVDSYYISPDNYMVIFDDKEYISYFEGNIIDDYEESDLKRMPYKSPRFIVMKYNSFDVVKRVIQQADFPHNIFIDDDHGFIGTINDYIKRI